MKNSGPCQMVTRTARIAADSSGVRRFCRIGRAYPRKLGSSLSGPLSGLTTVIAMASGTPSQASSTPSGTGAPVTTVRPIVAALTASGTASARAYQIQLTRQRISRTPICLSPAAPSATYATISAAIRAPVVK
jgi:hypothetical protein